MSPRSLSNISIHRVPKYLFELVYDEQKGKAWAYWQENSDAAKFSPPISYRELVERTGISLLPRSNEVATLHP